MVYAKTRICPRKRDPKILCVFEKQKIHQIPTRMADQVLINKKKKNVSSNGFCGSLGEWRENKRK